MRLGPAISVLALGVLSFLAALTLLRLFVPDIKMRENIAFFVGVLVLPPVCAWIQARIVRPDYAAPAGGFESLSNWLATAALLFLAASILLTSWTTGWTIPEWTMVAQSGIAAVLALYVFALIVLFYTSRRGYRPPAINLLRSRRGQIVAFALILPIAAIVLFRLDASVPIVTPIVGLLFSPPFVSGIGWHDYYVALSATAACIIASIALIAIEMAMLKRGSGWLQRSRRIAYGVGITLIPLLFFDYSLDADGLHYIAYLGPALHVFHGGTLLVDTFSQYGFAPVLLMMIGGKPSITNANLIVQLSNFLFYAIWLTCFYRMAPLKFVAILLGLLSVAVFLGGWAIGRGNVNTTPSVMAFRYLPALLMVFAISFLRPPQRHSFWTALAGFVAGLWSIETLIGTAGVQFAFLALVNFRARTPRKFATDLLIASIPAMAAFATIIGVTLARSGQLPNFLLYLEFLGAYNPTSSFWSMTAQPGFFGWMAMLACVFVVLADATARALVPGRLLPSTDDAALYYSYVPMVALLIFQASYYVFRSADFTLIIALFPFLAIVFSAALKQLPSNGGRRAASLFVFPALLVVTWALVFTFLALLRPSGPYEFFVQECRDHDRCDPQSLWAAVQKRRESKDVLEQVNFKYADNWFDKTYAVRDAVEAIARYGGTSDKTTVLLGKVAGWDVASEFALMYSGKWHRWPRSVTFSDDLVPRLVDRIVDAPVRLQPGELVVIRNDESTLGPTESGLLRRIRATVKLCPVPITSPQISVFRVAPDTGCPAS